MGWGRDPFAERRATMVNPLNWCSSCSCSLFVLPRSSWEGAGAAGRRAFDIAPAWSEDRAYDRGWRTFVPCEPRTDGRGQEARLFAGRSSIWRYCRTRQVAARTCPLTPSDGLDEWRQRNEGSGTERVTSMRESRRGVFTVFGRGAHKSGIPIEFVVVSVAT